MPRSQSGPPRASNGRFVKRRNSASKRPASSVSEVSEVSEVVSQDQSSQREGTVQLALVTLALVLGVLGFALSLFWVGALVVLGILWGVMVAERKQRHGTVKGLAAELVTTVVDEAKGVMEATSGSDPDSA